MKVLIAFHSLCSKGELAPTPEDLAICRAQGKRVAELARKIRG